MLKNVYYNFNWHICHFVQHQDTRRKVNCQSGSQVMLDSLIPRTPRWRCYSWTGNRCRGSPAWRSRPPPWSSLPGSLSLRDLSHLPDSPPPTFLTRSSSFATVRDSWTTHRTPSAMTNNNRQAPTAFAARSQTYARMPRTSCANNSRWGGARGEVRLKI